MMNENNPYEKDETVDIPDFPSIKDSDEDIDRSIFNMSDDESSSDVEDSDDEEYYEEEPTYLKVKKSAVIVAGVVLAVLLVLAIFGVVYGISNKNKYSSLKTEYDQYVATATAKETELNAKITELQTQINNANSNTSDNTMNKDNAVTYKVTSAVDDGIKVRSGAGTNYDQVKVSDLSEDLQKVVTEVGGYAYVNGNAEFTVYETAKDSSGNTWGRIDSNAWVCVIYGEDTYAYEVTD